MSIGAKQLTSKERDEQTKMHTNKLENALKIRQNKFHEERRTNVIIIKIKIFFMSEELSELLMNKQIPILASRRKT